MAPNLTLSLQLDDAQRLHDTLAEPWQMLHREAVRASVWDFLVARSLQLSENIDLAWAATCRELAAGEIEDVQGWRSALETVFDLTIAAAHLAHSRARAFQEKSGHVIERLEELTGLLRVLEQKRQRYLSRLSLLDEAVVAEGRAAYAAGDYPTAAAALADLLAARQARALTPPYAELRKWAQQSPPPSEWYSEADLPQ